MTKPAAALWFENHKKYYVKLKTDLQIKLKSDIANMNHDEIIMLMGQVESYNETIKLIDLCIILYTKWPTSDWGQ